MDDYMQRNDWRLVGKYTKSYNKISREVTDVSILKICVSNSQIYLTVA